ncbi:MAG TPA: hypothetical protein VJA26_09660 [Gammaproteobacteria bacterium]|nr:hypothetical protein [Gammaproteobacteria bacterium]
MKAFVDWVLARRYRLILLAIVFAPVLPIVTAALISVDTARRGAIQGLISALLGVGGLLLLAALAGASSTVFATLGLISFLSGVGIGVLLHHAGNLTLAFQGAVLFSFLLVGAMSLLGPDPRTVFEPVVEMLRASGASPEQIAVIEESGGILFAAAVFSQLMAPLLLGCWWLILANGGKGFGAEFRSLKLGRLLGVPATAVVALGLVFDAPLVQNLTALALLAFVLQGLAVLHAWVYAKRWHPGVVAPVYVLLVTPLVMLSLSAVGLVDTWFDLRASLRPQA